MLRDYPAIASRLVASGPRAARMQRVVDALWESLQATGVSWVGFYLPERGPDGGTHLVLGPRRDKPACSPIGLHGACGRCYVSRQPVLVPDVRELGENYIACDPRDQSEVVVPCLEPNEDCWGVLDLDSHDVGSFDALDIAGLTLVLRAAELTR
ncbi:MAG: GAF domain-containing protein [Phycisphaerales bacterium]|nr:GAF domain-containing protein [Phycisphaerales bacterium]